MKGSLMIAMSSMSNRKMYSLSVLLLVMLLALNSDGGYALISPPPLSPRSQHHNHDVGRSVRATNIKPLTTSSPFPFSVKKGNSASSIPLLRWNNFQVQQPRHHSGDSALVLRSSSSVSSSSSEDDAITTTPVSIALLVGIASALLGYLYSKCLKIGFNVLWKQFPNSSISKSFIPSSKHIMVTMTMAGTIVATLSTLYFPKMFSAHEYIHILSQEDHPSMDKFPGDVIKSIVPLMGLSLLTSVSGFSLGPEAPMVGAGSVVGVNLGRRYIASKEKDSKIDESKLEETLAYAGAAGALTGAMNVPLAGPIFALEFTSRHGGLTNAAGKSWSAVMMATLAGMAVVRGLLGPGSHVGGHFTYTAKAAVGALHGREMVLGGFLMGVSGAVVGTCFHKAVAFLKKSIWSKKGSSSKAVSIGKKVLLVMIIGWISTLFPQTMFWGEPSLQCMVDGQCTAFSATPHGIPAAMMQAARVNPNEPFASGAAALQVGLAKLSAIALASCAKLPGGVIFPLLSNGASLGHSLVSALQPFFSTASSSLVAPMMIMSFMCAMLTSITRTPLGSVLILAFTASGITPLSVLLPGVLLASYVSVWVSERLSKDTFFSYSE